MARITYAEFALRDLEDVREWYVSQDAPEVGQRLVGEVMAAVEQLGRFPESGRVVPEFDTPQLRELIHPPFRIVYRLAYDNVRVVRVWRSERLVQEP
jgi:plasmid stabilization system protein ParE